MPEPAPHRTSSRLEVRILHRVGALAIDVEFTATKPWTILFGPSGSGKTTILRAIAGLLRPDEARIVSATGGEQSVPQSVLLVDSGTGTDIPAHLRAVRYAPQQPALFPHRTVLQNVIYGMSNSGRDDGGQAEFDGLLEASLETFQLAHLAHKYPAQLSGGEAQRVNLARACLATGCRLLLLDEPFTGLDAGMRSGIVKALTERTKTTQILSVTHDIAEAFELGAEVIQLHEGKVVAQGPVHEVLAQERLDLLRRLGSEELPLRSVEPFLGG